MQTVDFVALATRASGGAEGIRACLIQSREGLTLGVHPAEAEQRLREAWRGLQAVGDAHRGFVELGEEIVVVSRRGPYVGVVLAAPGVRPGLVLDVLEAHLGEAEVARAGGSQPEVPAETPRTAPARRRRPSRHAAAARRGQPREIELPAEALAKALAEEEPAAPEPGLTAAADAAPTVVEVPEPAGTRGLGARLKRLAGAPPVAIDAPPAFEEAVAEPPTEVAEEPPPPPPAQPAGPRVDRAALAREFGRLFSEPGGEQD